MKSKNTSVQNSFQTNSSNKVIPIKNDFNEDDYDDSESDDRLHAERSESNTNFKIQLIPFILEWE